MKTLLFLVFFVSLSSCEPQTFNSVSQDETLFVEDTGLSVNFEGTRAIMRTYCIQCHAAFPTYSEADWIANGLVVAGFPTSSTLYQRLRGVGLGGSNENMPPTGTLANEEKLTIYNWILNLR